MMMRNKKWLILPLLLLINLNLVSAVIIDSIETNQDTYSNGDVIEITLYANSKNLDIKGDFGRIDSNYHTGSVISITPEDFKYQLFYPITYGNTKGDDDYPVIISIYDSSVESSSIVSYSITLKNENRQNKSSSSESIILKMRNLRDYNDYNDNDYNPNSNNTNTGTNNLIVEDGKIAICTDTGCSFLTEEEYEAGRRIIINSGQVELAGLTYNQLKNEIQKDVSETMRKEVNNYINNIIQINKDLNDAVYDIKEIVKETQSAMANNTNQTSRVITQGFYFNVFSMLFTIIIVSAALYGLYLKTHTTWFEQ
jgi:hypothetical protein